ncbi:23931_t:CDS:2 [Gigaspora margarita]|uniref:23931_t:CDS:1 n=1 Tax=Gigaspora margarita TaxID=4874 RepID=A0ABM8W0M3_GIGMA|nr:23931_t:CDS:2 [Gigaspora margarita]
MQEEDAAWALLSCWRNTDLAGVMRLRDIKVNRIDHLRTSLGYVKKYNRCTPIQGFENAGSFEWKVDDFDLEEYVRKKNEKYEYREIKKDRMNEKAASVYIGTSEK